MEDEGEIAENDLVTIKVRDKDAVQQQRMAMRARRCVRVV